MSSPNLIRLESASSTNEYAAHLLLNSTPAEFTVIWTLGQYSGKGLGGTVWESEPGKNLTFSIIIYPYFLDIGKQFTLNRAVALGVHDFISKLTDPNHVTIKWPNDIYYKDKKISGILIENAVMDRSFKHSVIGIGINLNQLSFPPELPNAVSLREITGTSYRLEESLEKVCEAIRLRYRELSLNPDGVNAGEYISKLYRFNKPAPYRYHGENIHARITGVEESGHLSLETDDGKKLVCDLKEVQFLQK